MADHVHTPEDASRVNMYQGLGELARYLERMIRSLQELELPIQATSTELPKASEHLHDLVKMTEEGTHTVMTLTEGIQDLHPQALNSITQIRQALANVGLAGGVIPGHLDILEQMITKEDQHLMDIMTALSFQDLVGQKIKKLVTILDDVQHKLVEMVVVFGPQMKPNGSSVKPEESGEARQMLKELEASKTTALKQDLVDDILGQFGFS